MADKFEIAHRTPGRTRLRWCGAGVPPEAVLDTFAASSSVHRMDYRPATGSVVLVHGAGMGIEGLSKLARPFDIAIIDKPLPLSPRPPRRASANGSRPKIKQIRGDEPVPPSQAGSDLKDKWAPIVADIEAVVLFGLILGWIRDWFFSGRGVTFGTVILAIITATALAIFWWRRRSKAAPAEPELEFIYA